MRYGVVLAIRSLLTLPIPVAKRAFVLIEQKPKRRDLPPRFERIRPNLLQPARRLSAAQTSRRTVEGRQQPVERLTPEGIWVVRRVTHALFLWH